MKAITSCEGYRRFAQQVMQDELATGRQTKRYKLAEGMLQVYDQIEHKRSLRAAYEWKNEQREEERRRLRLEIAQVRQRMEELQAVIDEEENSAENVEVSTDEVVA